MEISHCYEHCSHIREQGAAFISEGKETDRSVEAYHDENATVVARGTVHHFFGNDQY